MIIFQCKVETQERPFVARLSTGADGVFIAMEGAHPYLKQDDARRLARAILAIPRPVDAPKETI